MCFDTFRLPPLRERETQEKEEHKTSKIPLFFLTLKQTQFLLNLLTLLRTKFLWIDENRNPATEYPVKMQMRYAKSIHSA